MNTRSTQHTAYSTWARGRTWIFLLIPLIVALAGAGVVGYLFMSQRQQTERLQEQLNLSQQQLTQLEQQNQELTQRLDGLQAERGTLDDQVGALRVQLTQAAEDLQRSRESLQEFQERHEQLNAERLQLHDQVAGLVEERNRLQSQVQHVTQDSAELQRAVTSLRQRLVLLDRDYKKLTEEVARLKNVPNPAVAVVGTDEPGATPDGEVVQVGGAATTGDAAGEAREAVELPPIVVRRGAAAPAGPIQGRLIEVDASRQFVVVDKGSENGVQPGMTFDIVRGPRTVGRATVVRVRPTLSACDIVRASTPNPLRIGDLAVQNGNLSR